MSFTSPDNRGSIIFIKISFNRLLKRNERSQNKAKFGEKAAFMPVIEYFEPNFNAVLASAIVLTAC